MAEEIDENEFFHEDYTTASDWEVFNHRLNETFVTDFNLTEISNNENCDLESCEWEIIEKEISFASTFMTVRFYKAEPTSSTPSKSPFISTKCRIPIPRYFLTKAFVVVEPESENLVESQVRMLLSSVLMSMEESGIEKIPVFITDNRKFRNMFFGVSREATKRTSLDAIHIDEIPPMFRYLSGILAVFKAKVKESDSTNSISAQLSYSLKVGTGANSPFPESSRFLLPYGVSSDPIRQISLKCTWLDIMENVLVDSANYSGLDPETAPVWSLSVQLETHIKPIYHLSKCMEDYLRLKNNVRTLQSTAAILDDYINDDNIKLMFTYLFPPSNVNYYENIDEEFNQQYKKHGIKTAPSDSIVTRFSCILSTYNNSMGGMNSVGSLWLFFTNELSRRVEKCLKIPGILTATNTPDARTCLLHQKLQLLNICIEKKKIEEGRTISEDESEEDEFYDCPPEIEEDGRLKQLDDLMLLHSPSEPLYIPITQELGPKTEDQLLTENLSEQTESALLSDMESFKAANLKATFEDFIRWHSPRDWIDGALSPRMELPGNSWLVMWDNANPVPARKQKKLFDFNEEASKIIKFFETRTIGEICDLTLSTLLHSILLKLESEGDPALEERFNKIHEHLKYTINHSDNYGNGWNEVIQELSAMDSLINKTKKLSAKLNNSGLEFCDILKLLNGEEVQLGDFKRGKLYDLLTSYCSFSEATGEPYKKDYVLKTEKSSQFMRAILHDGLTLCGAFSEETALF
ncbi:RAB3GAP1 family protein [Megaselia abdita]